MSLWCQRIGHGLNHLKEKTKVFTLLIGTRAPHGCLPASMLRTEKYSLVPSRVMAINEVDMNVSFDLVTNKIGALTSGAGKRHCQVSIFSSRICLPRILDQLL